MYRYVNILTLFGLLLTFPIVCADDSPEAKKELEKFQGKWTVVSIQSPTMGTAPKEALAKMKVEFKGERMIVLDEGRENDSARVVLKPSERHIDLVYQIAEKGSDENSGAKRKTTERTVLGIYAFDGKKLKLCFGEPKEPNSQPPRPKSVEVKPLDDGSGQAVMMLEKEKP